MSDDQPEPNASILHWPSPGSAASPQGVVGFDRRELRVILNLYGKMVAQGDWRDYAMDFLPTRAIFSIFRRSGEAAYYRIIKEPKAARKQGAYSIVMQTGLILKRGPDLPHLLGALEKKPKLTAL